MKRIISFLIIICFFICSTGFAGFDIQPAVFDALCDDDPGLFLLSDTESGNTDKNSNDSGISDKEEDTASGEKDQTGDTNGSDISDKNKENNGSDSSDKNTDNNGSGDKDKPENTNDPESSGETAENTEPGDNGDSSDTDPAGEESADTSDTDIIPELPETIDIPISDDYFSATQYSFHNTGTYLKYSGEQFTEQTSAQGIDLDVARGWMAYAADGLAKQPVIVAVIDTGVDYTHPDLADNMWINPLEIPDNGKDDDGNGYVDDIYGWDFYNDDNTVCHYITDESGNNIADPDDCDDHGTHIAGLIGAVKDNSIGIAGLASVGNVRIMSLKIHGGANRKGKLSDAIKAIRYAESMGASVCNISWGTYTYSASLASAIRNSKMLFVCAAGNDGSDNDKRPIYPACFGFDNIISVGFVNADGKLPFNSNYGQNSVDIVAPAVDIMSTTVGSYSTSSGSSMAAPQISAVAALLYSYGGRPWAGAVRDAILGSIRELDELEKIVRYPGIPSLAAAVYNIDRLPHDFTPPDFSIGISYDVNGIKVSFTPTDRGGSGIGTIRYLTGTRTYEDFKNGTEGLAVENNTLYLAKPGIYTFLAEDRAGNYLVKSFPIMDDIILPNICDAFLTIDGVASQMSVSAHVSDLHSGIRTVKYLRGRHSAADFKSASAGTVLIPDDDGLVSFMVSEQGSYTIFASDNRGNTATATVMAYTRPIIAAVNNDNETQSLSAGINSSTRLILIKAAP
ncbi:MAG: S8 family serine peptidase [Lachnospiraceae bacterium]|nr:S8 family serine peptidase [Lachnospiraceae bacterium]